MTDTERKAQKGKTMNEIKKLTDRQFYDAIIAGTVTEEIIDHAKKKLAALDAQNEKRKETLRAKREAENPIKDAVMAWMVERNAPALAADLFAAGIEGIANVSKASTLLVQLSKEGKLTKAEVKVKGKGRCNQYSLPAKGEE